MSLHVDVCRDESDVFTVSNADIVAQIGVSSKKVVEAQRNLDSLMRRAKIARPVSLAKDIAQANRTLQNMRKEACSYCGIALARGLFDDCAAFLDNTPEKAG